MCSWRCCAGSGISVSGRVENKMKKIFKVTIHFMDGSTNEYRVLARTDLDARAKAEKMEKQSWKDFGHKEEYVDLDFCEIKLICMLDD